jgi:hypothetical protein
MVDVLATEDPVALVLSWWCRIEKALAYYTTAYHGKTMRRAVDAIDLLRADELVEPKVIERLHALRCTRNDIAHGKTATVLREEARMFASEALHLVWDVGCRVPDELAITSGAARVC